jgi:Kef-type K+ transport system membrane component KefB/mannitol/fructose-specific phosphotransferase system IIA component (Ntr-type)
MSRVIITLIVLVMPGLPALASEGLQDVPMTHEITRLLLQLGVIILAAKGIGSLARRLRLPALLGEVSAGLLLGPYALGQLAVPGFPDGLIPLAAGAFPVSLQLYGFAAVGAVIHVLVVGLESDLGLFARTRQRGFAVGMGSSLASLVVGIVVPVLFFRLPLLDRRVFFFAALSVSTSLGVQARILHAQNRMGTPVGAAIVSASLMQDGFAIVFLAIAMAIGSVELGRGVTAGIWSAVLPVAMLAMAILLGGGFLSFAAAPKLARIFRNRSTPTMFAILVVGLALVLSALFETFGVAAIIGAYIIGISFSRTDIGDVLAEKTQPLSEFFVPVLYVVMGMLVDWRMLSNPAIVLPGIAFAVLSAVAKIAGSGFPALATGFTRWGALRIGLGTVPRGEVALIIASVGLALGDFSLELFQMMVVMIVFSVAVGAPLLSVAIRHGGPGTSGQWGRNDTQTTSLDLPNEELSDLITDGLLRVAEDDGFFVHRLELAGAVYRLRRDEVFLTIHRSPTRLEIVSDPQDAGIAKTLLYEVIVHVRDRVARITELTVPKELRRDVAAGSGRSGIDLASYVSPAIAAIPLLSTDKAGVIRELVDKLDRAGRIADRDMVLADVMEREATVSTGMEKGIAIPHARTQGVRGMALAIGLCPHGVDFQALDGEPARLIFLIASAPDDRGPHLQLLAAIAKRMRDEERRNKALAAGSPEELAAAILG